MVTSKLVTNIYYGESEYLKERLNGLVDDGAIAYWVFILHHGERQYNPIENAWVGDRLKDHIHVGIKPNKRLNFDIVYGECIQMVGGKLTGFTRNWEIVRSTMDFWLYLFHFKDYLAAKNLVREYNYSKNDIVCSDNDVLQYELNRALEEFWVQHGISHEVQKVVKGQMKETELFARHLRDAWGVDRLLKAARRDWEVMINEKNSNRQNDFCQISAVCS